MEDNFTFGLLAIAVGIVGFITGFTTKVDKSKEEEFKKNNKMDFFEKLNYVPPSAHRVRGFVVGIVATIIGILHLLNIL